MNYCKSYYLIINNVLEDKKKQKFIKVLIKKGNQKISAFNYKYKSKILKKKIEFEMLIYIMVYYLPK